MQKFGTKKIISIVSGLTITGTIVGTAVVLMNMASASNNIVGISFDNLTTIYNSILNEYGSNSQNSALTELEFKSKVDDGSIKKWMLDNFSKYFISENSEIGINFNLLYENNSLMILPLRNTTFKINYTNGSDSNISLQNNRIIIKFKISDFLQEKLFSFSQLNSIKNTIISDMSNNKVTFSELTNLDDEQQKEINSWITRIFGVGEVFETISFEKNTGTNKNLYSISLKPKKDFIFGWNTGSSNNDEFNVFKNEIKINFLDAIEISNETLNELWNSINQFIWDQQIDYYDWLSHFSAKDNKYNEFKQFIYDKLNSLMPNDIDNIDIIGDLNLSVNNRNYSLSISPGSGYRFISSSDYFTFPSINLSNLEFYKYINLTSENLENLYNSLQNKITSNRWTQSEFNDWYTEQNIKEFVSQNLTTSNDSLIDSNLIGTISYDPINSSIQISPVVMYRFELISNTKNISIDNRGNILISGLTFFTSGKLVNLEDLVDAVQNIISTNRMTVEEFSQYVTDKQSQLKNTIRKNLYISNNSTISSDEIGEISLDNNNLVIELTPPANFKYVIHSSITNVSLDVNTLSISGLEYYKINTLTNLNSFYNVVQQQILDEKWTVEEFKNYIDNNESEFKNKIITNISTTDGTPITLNEIGDISITNNNLTIELLVPENVRYEADLVTNTSLSNDVLTFSNFQYYTATNFTRLNDLVNAIQNVIDSNQFTNYDFRDYLESEYNATFKQTVTNNLFVSANSTIAANQVQSVQFDNNNVVIILEIPGPNAKYTSDANSDVVLSNNTLIVNNLKYFSKVNITKLDVLHTAIQNKIDELSATNTDFATYVQQNTSLIKSLVQQNLYVSLNTTISLDQIISVTYDSGNLVVSLANPGERVKYVADIDQNISFANNSLTISGLKYFNTINLSNLNKLYSTIQDKIDSKLYTNLDFANYVNINQDELKQLVAENINVSSSATIDVDKIKSVAFANNQFTISLDSERLNYTISSATNISLSNYVLTLSDLKTYTNIAISGTILNNLKETIQNKINEQTNRYTVGEFLIVSEQFTFKSFMTTTLGISSSNLIKEIKFNSDNTGNLLKIIPKDYNKFIASGIISPLINENDGSIEIRDLTFFEIYNIVKTNDLFNKLQEYITLNRWTVSDLRTQLGIPSSFLVTDVIYKNLFISDTDNLNSNWVTGLSVDNNGNITITLDSNYRFSIELNGNSNVQLNGNQIIIRNLIYFKKIGVSDANLLNLRKTIQNYIDMNFVTSTTINSNIANINNLVSFVQTTNNDGNLGDYVNSVTVSGTTITIPLRSGTKMDTKSIPNITVNETSISISGFTYYVQPAPVTSYFTWSGNTITGLTSSGSSQRTLTLPSSATAISNNAFQNRTNIEVIDMSLSQITSIPAGSSTSGIFYGCTNLRAVQLPNACTFIGYGAFYNCASIVDITLPPNLTTFGRYGLSGCTGIKSFTLPNKVTSVGQYLFNGCSNMTTIKLSDTMPWLNHYMFNGCSSLQEVYIPNSVTELRSYVFNGCRNLAWVRMSDNISTIDTNAFNGAPNTLIVYVSTQALKNRLTSMNLVNLPSSRIFVGTPS